MVDLGVGVGREGREEGRDGGEKGGKTDRERGRLDRDGKSHPRPRLHDREGENGSIVYSYGILSERRTYVRMTQ